MGGKGAGGKPNPFKRPIKQAPPQLFPSLRPSSLSLLHGGDIYDETITLMLHRMQLSNDPQEQKKYRTISRNATRRLSMYENLKKFDPIQIQHLRDHLLRDISRIREQPTLSPIEEENEELAHSPRQPSRQPFLSVLRSRIGRPSPKLRAGVIMRNSILGPLVISAIQPSAGLKLSGNVHSMMQISRGNLDDY